MMNHDSNFKTVLEYNKMIVKIILIFLFGGLTSPVVTVSVKVVTVVPLRAGRAPPRPPHPRRRAFGGAS